MVSRVVSVVSSNSDSSRYVYRLTTSASSAMDSSERISSGRRGGRRDSSSFNCSCVIQLSWGKFTCRARTIHTHNAAGITTCSGTDTHGARYLPTYIGFSILLAWVKFTCTGSYLPCMSKAFLIRVTVFLILVALLHKHIVWLCTYL